MYEEGKDKEKRRDRICKKEVNMLYLGGEKRSQSPKPSKSKERRRKEVKEKWKLHLHLVY